MSQACRSLGKNQRKALVALLSSNSVEAAAREAGLSSRTIWRYLSDEAFAAELARREVQTVEHAARWLARELEATVSVLIAIRDDTQASQSTRLRACATLLSAALDLRGLSLERRLSALEERVFGNVQ